MNTIGLAIAVAVIVEALIEYAEPAFNLIEDPTIKKAAKQGTAIALALLFAFEIKITILSAIFTETFAVVINPTFDMIVSGICMSRGSNYLSDLIRLIYNKGTKEDESWFDDFEDDEEDYDEDQEQLEQGLLADYEDTDEEE